MSSSQDTEITLGTGKMLVLFFALAALCGVFFAMGYKLGRSSAGTAAAEAAAPAETAPASATQTAAVKPAASSAASPDLAYYQAQGGGKETSHAAAPPEKSSSQAPGPEASTSTPSTPAAASTSAPPDPAQAAGEGYYVQVAAVSKQEDANALVDALKRKQYPAFVASGGDNLYRVQVGPFADVKNAEDMRARLVNDGYNPILKK
ncbi:MAG TPA: SPOR domain-containing protein [Terriglobales bacterium]|nr:SPOR domain-containing protein [Terriglobales bacterium]